MVARLHDSPSPYFPPANVTFQDVFSSNISATWSNGLLTIQDFGLGRSLSLPVAASDPWSWDLVEAPHTAGGLFTGLTLETANQAIHDPTNPTIVIPPLAI